MIVLAEGVGRGLLGVRRQYGAREHAAVTTWAVLKDTDPCRHVTKKFSTFPASRDRLDLRLH